MMGDLQNRSELDPGRGTRRVQRHVTYNIGNSRLHIVFGDISTATTDVIMTSDDTHFSMGGGTSKAVLEAAGEEIRKEAQKQGPVEPGTVIITAPWKLGERGVKRVFHAAVVRPKGQEPVQDQGKVVREATSRAITLLAGLNHHSIAIPALGTGFGKYGPKVVALAMIEALRPALGQSKKPLEVELWLYFRGSERDYDTAKILSEVTNAAELGSAVVQKHGVVLLHGIRTAAGWRMRIGDEIRDADSGLTPIPIGYGFFNILCFIFPGPWRQAAAETVWKKMNVVFENPNLDRVSIVAHSFGTWITGYLLKHKNLKFHRVLFCGAILDTRYDWPSAAAKISGPTFHPNPVARVINDCGTRDIWPIFARSVTWGYDMSGRWGFQNALVQDRFHSVTHSGFFEQGFAAKYWVPALTQDVIERGPKLKDKEISPPHWLTMLSVVKIPYLVLVVLLGVFAWLYWGR
jgi:O-acetyl-ADP-ribose deacetylase (regulator of RNase III)